MVFSTSEPYGSSTYLKNELDQDVISYVSVTNETMGRNLGLKSMKNIKDVHSVYMTAMPQVAFSERPELDREIDNLSVVRGQKNST